MEISRIINNLEDFNQISSDNELDLIQMSLSMYFNGDIVYETEE